MNHPIIVLANAQLKYNGMLTEADIYNRLKKGQAGRNGQVATLLSSLGDRLIAAGRKLKGQGSPQVEPSA